MKSTPEFICSCGASALLLLAACGGGNQSPTGTIGNSNSAGPNDNPPLTRCAVAPAAASSNFCSSDSWIAGVSEICNGRLVYRDYIYDDYGADTGARTTPISTGRLAPSAGDQTYPAGLENTADLVRLELRADGDELVAEFELNTLYNGDETVAVIAIDTDNDPNTGGGIFTGFDISAEGWDTMVSFTTGDADSNIISGRLPRPTGDAWRVWAFLAQADGTVMNVAFRGINERAATDGSSNLVNPATGNFWEDIQAGALSEGDITGLSTTFCGSELQTGTTRGAIITPGFHQRVYTSAYTLAPGEGVSLDGIPGRHGDTGGPCEQYFNYLGKYQPFGIYIPDQAGPHGLQFDLHGCSANHASIINQPGFQQQFGEDLNRIIVVPLGRGPVGFYSDISERDVLDVFDNVTTNYDIDEDAVVMGGYSMGGYGAMRTAALYPDRFAAITNWVGFTGDVLNTPFPGNPGAGGNAGGMSSNIGAVGNVIDFIGNFRHLPSVNIYSAADELVQANTSLALQQRFDDTADLEHDFYIHPNAEHLTYVVLDDWQKEADYSADRRLVKNPARVTYRTDAELDYSEYAIKHDRAYWVSEITGVAEGYIDVDIYSLGCGLPITTFTDGNDAGAGPAPLTWGRQFREPGGSTEVTAENRLEATLANVSSMTVDLDPTCLTPGFSYDIITDNPVAIRFSDGRTLTLAAGNNSGTF